MPSSEDEGERVSLVQEAVTALLILGTVSGAFVLGFLIRWTVTAVTGDSLAFALPPAGRVLGGAIVVAGAAVAGSTFTVREPRAVLDSTAVTLAKLIRREPAQRVGARSEPFVPVGPYRWTRNPMYLGVVLILFGLGILLVSATVLLWGAVLAAYLLGLLIPREEKELEALFGYSYKEYKRQVPVLFPTGRRLRPDQPEKKQKGSLRS